jgi:hypothetical protein
VFETVQIDTFNIKYAPDNDEAPLDYIKQLHPTILILKSGVVFSVLGSQIVR